MIVLGLCCISKNLQDRKPPVKCRIIQKKYYTLERAIQTAKENLEDVYTLIQYAAENKIYSLRLPSDILPRYTDKNVEKYDMKMFQPLFTKIGNLAHKHSIRLSFHPDQFVVLSSDSETITQNSFDELSYQCEMLHRMGVSAEEGVCNIHGGGVYGLDKSIVKKRWADNFKRLPENVRRYITLENDERSYSLEDCLDISKLCGVPVVYDTFHEECYRSTHKEEFKDLKSLVRRTIKTWTVTLDDGTVCEKLPMCHVSNQKPGERVGVHSNYIDVFPEILWYYAEICDSQRNTDLYVDVEAKEKDLAVFQLRGKYPDKMI